MSEQAKQTPQELKQSILRRVDSARKAIEELNEEELESIVGGINLTIPKDTMTRTMDLMEDPLPSLNGNPSNKKLSTEKQRPYYHTMAIGEN